jgi:hypothetical protein
VSGIERIPTPAPLRHQREVAIQRLCEHFTQDHINADELERLIDRTHDAATLAELESLMQTLPALRPSTHAAPVPLSETEDRQTVVAIMGGAERKGAWTSARGLNVVAFMGGVVLDFREARLPAGRTEIRVVAIMGGVEIIVPPGLSVTGDGVGIMGGFAHAAERGARSNDPDPPRLHVTGLALMGGVEISEREPGESEKEARRRRKRERGDRGHGRHGPGGGA